jgi:acyl-CoA hydrolase
MRILIMTAPITAKLVSESAIHDYAYKAFPNDLNANGTVFGGLVMATLDRVASVVAERHTGKTCVTASVDALHFLAPAKDGDILIFQAAVNRTWRSSMEIGVKVLAEDYRTRDKRHIVSAYFTFVAVNERGQPIEVPAIIPETALEKRRYEDANIRREQRRQAAETLRQQRS